MIEELQPNPPGGSLVRIPPETDVPLSHRVAAVIDTAAMRRLARISQLGLVHLVYPGATHSRFEHSLGVYRNAVRLLTTLGGAAELTPRECEAFLLAALVHDVGHWPFCHAVEDMQLEATPRHEERAAALLQSGELADRIAADWSCDGDDVMSLLLGRRVGGGLSDRAIELLSSCLSGPIDVDKLDYLIRDSLHAGVPYGRHFDVARLIASMTVDPSAARLAIHEKGRTAAEMMVFARYVMFSEVYWHHAVRAATAMLQRSVHDMYRGVDWAGLMELDEAGWIAAWRQAAAGSAQQHLVEGLFGPTRVIYKRAAEFNVAHGGDIHRRLARRPYAWLVLCCDELGRLLQRRTGLAIRPGDVLIDAPPVKLEVDINVAVTGRDGNVRMLADVSPVAEALARRQFDDHVKRVRVFVRPELRQAIVSLGDLEQLVIEAVEKVERELV